MTSRTKRALMLRLHEQGFRNKFFASAMGISVNRVQSIMATARYERDTDNQRVAENCPQCGRMWHESFHCKDCPVLNLMIAAHCERA